MFIWKKSRRKTFFTTVVATLAVLSISVTASASDVEAITDNSSLVNISDNNETVLVGGYECQVVDGHYLTYDNGEICEVIDLSQTPTVSMENADTTANTILSQQATNEVDISDGSKYYGTIDATTKDYVTPVFIGWHDKSGGDDIHPDSRTSYALHCENFVFNRSHYVEVTLYDPVYKQYFSEEPRTIIFSLFVKTYYFVNGMTNNEPTKMYFTFPKGDGNAKVTDYSVYTVLKEY